MYLDNYQKFYLIAGIILVAISVLNFVSRRKRYRYMRFFKRAYNVRFKLINQICKHPGTLPNDLTPQELVATLVMISARHSVSQSFAMAIRYDDSNTQPLFTEDFFSQLFSTAKRFQSAIWTKESMEIMNLGKMLAEHFQNTHWQNKFQDQIKTLRYYHSGNTTTYASNKANLKR